MIAKSISFTTAALLAGAIAGPLILTGCRNAPEERREQLREQANSQSRPDGLSRADAIKAATQALTGTDATKLPAMRWQAAQNLGNLGALEGYDLLLERCLGGVADGNATVRRECVIALAKLPYPNTGDVRRVSLIAKLRDRIAFDRIDSIYSPLVESDGLVRMAMLDAIISLGAKSSPSHTKATAGHRDAADAVYQVLTQLFVQRNDPRLADVQVRVNDGLVEASLHGLTRLSALPADTILTQRRDQSLQKFISWWAEQVRQMPEMYYAAPPPPKTS